VSEARRIAALAGAHHLPCTLHASSILVVFLASLHVAAALGEVESLEYHMLHQWLFAHAPAGMLDVRGGMLALPDGPGIGVALTPDDVSDEGEESGS